MRKNIIFGIGRVQKDFEYIFDELPIEGYFIENWKMDITIWNGKKIFTWEEVKNQRKKYQIIICDFDWKAKKEFLEQYGFIYGVDYKLADDYFPELDVSIENVLFGREIYIWGTGYCANILMEDRFLENKVCGFIDNNKEKAGNIFHGKSIIYPKTMELEFWKDKFIIIAVEDYFLIKLQLREYGLKEEYGFIWYKKIMNRPSHLLKKTIYDKTKYQLVCNTMFNTYEIESTGDVACCCTTFINERIGNLIYQNFQDIWYSNLHKVLCLSAANQTYTFCKSDMCPVLMEKEKCEYKNTYTETDSYNRIEEKPKVMLISIDSSCNLYCESCRDHINILKGEEYCKAQTMADKLLKDDNFKNAEFIVMAGNGEVFLSKIYEKIWSNEKTKYAKRFRLLSNGTLFTPSKWKKFSEGRNSEIVVTFSIDAATAETYSLVRRGANFDNLMENLQFASSLRKSGEIIYLQISFVVQRKNFKEIPLFVELGKQLNVDKVFFTRILNWGTYSEKEFQEISMTDDNGHANSELQQILDMPIMNDSIVDLGTINSKNNEKDFSYVDNYYLWEIDRYLKK